MICEPNTLSWLKPEFMVRPLPPASCRLSTLTFAESVTVLTPSTMQTFVEELSGKVAGVQLPLTVQLPLPPKVHVVGVLSVHAA